VQQVHAQMADICLCFLQSRFFCVLCVILGPGEVE
jgi:hypothetical protein